MKPLYVFSLLVLIATAAFAQQPDTLPKTLFKSKPITNIGFNFTGGASVSNFYNREAIFTNIGFGIMLNNHFRGGLDVEILTSNVDVANTALVFPSTRMRWRYSAFGLNLDYTFMPKKVISINPGLVIGLGTVSKHPLDGANQNNDQLIDDSNMFVLRPNLSVNFNLIKFMTLKIGGGYRYATGSKSLGISDSQMATPYGFVALRFEIGGPISSF